MSLIKVGSNILFSADEWVVLSSVINISGPIEITVKEKCKRGCNLHLADVALGCLVENLPKTGELAKTMRSRLLVRIYERQTSAADVLGYLSSSKFPFLAKITQVEIIDFITEFNDRLLLDGNNNSQDIFEASDESTDNDDSDYAAKLSKTIEKGRKNATGAISSNTCVFLKEWFHLSFTRPLGLW